MSKIIKAENITKVYKIGTQSLKALDNVSMHADKGEFISVVGQSGSGKSTLMNILGCLDKPDFGDYYLHSKNVAKLREKKLSDIRCKNIGFVFQKFNLISTLSALENVELPLLYMGYPKLKRRIIAKNALESVGLDSRMSHKPYELSGGQQQRVAVARAISTDPEIILADEPTGNLDSECGKQIMSLLCSLNEKGKTIVLITHDLETAQIAHRVITVKDGKIM